MSGDAMQVRDASPRYGVVAQDVPPGYKRTVPGVIPSDWDVQELESLGSGSTPPIKAGPFGSSLTKATYVSNGYKVYGQEQVIRGDHLYGDYFIDRRKYLELESCAVRAGDILLSLVGTAGKLLVVPEGARPGIINPRLIRFSFDRSRINSRFFRFLFESEQVQARLARQAQGGTMGVLSAGNLRSFLVQLPSPIEQRAIAEALSDVDGLLGALEALIAKKRAIKQAAMQQLLTGKTRLPGFSGEWETKRLGEIADLHRQGVVPAQFGEQLFTHLSLPAFDDGKAAVVESGHSIGSNKFRVPENAVLVSKLNPRIPRVWAPNHVAPNAVASTEFLVLTPKRGTSRQFLYVVCSSPAVSEQLELSATGTTGSHQRISPSDALKIAIRIPEDPNEQIAVATVLSDMDAEIAALETRRDKTRAIKQGMMQQLLTGRVRLVKPASLEIST